MTPTKPYRGGECPHGVYRDTRCFVCRPQLSDVERLREAIEDALNGVSTYGRPLTDYMEPGLVAQLRAALDQEP